MADPTLPKDQQRESIDVLRPSSSQDVDGTLSSTQSSVLDGTVIRVVAEGGAGTIAFGANPTATTTDTYLPQGHVEYFKIITGERVAVFGAVVNVVVME